MPVPVQRKQEEVLPRDRLQGPRRTRSLQHRVAERPAERVQDGRAGQERDGPSGEVRQEFGTEIVRHESVGAIERSDARGLVAAGLDRRGPPGRARPASLRSDRSGRRAVPAEGRPRRPRMSDAASRASSARSSVPTSRTRPLARSRVIATAGASRPAMANCDPAGRCSARVVRASTASRSWSRWRSSTTRTSGWVVAERAAPSRGTRVDPIETPGEARASYTPWSDRLDPIECEREVGQQDGRVVVPAIQRDPGEAAAIGLGPLGQDGRLPVPGRRQERHDRSVDRGQSAARPMPAAGRCLSA